MVLSICLLYQYSFLFVFEKFKNATSFPHEHDQSKSAVITPQ